MIVVECSEGRSKIDATATEARETKVHQGLLAGGVDATVHITGACRTIPST